MLTVYQQQYASSRTAQGQSIMAYIESGFERNADARTMVSASGEMSRAGALRFWAQQQSLGDPVGLLVAWHGCKSGGNLGDR